LTGDLSALVLLDLSAVFDTVDHDILIQWLKTSDVLSGSVLLWVSYKASADLFLDPFCSLVSSLILTRLDYSDGSLVGIPLYQLERLQSVMNSLSGWCFPRRDMTTSLRSSVSCTGSKH